MAIHGVVRGQPARSAIQTPLIGWKTTVGVVKNQSASTT
jgi:hypothetical protein